MAKHLECVMPACVFTVSAETEADVLQQIAVHAAHAHGITDIPEELAAQVKAAITDGADRTKLVGG